jgi:hypothetical protein
MALKMVCIYYCTNSVHKSDSANKSTLKGARTPPCTAWWYLDSGCLNKRTIVRILHFHILLHGINYNAHSFLSSVDKTKGSSIFLIA